MRTRNSDTTKSAAPPKKTPPPKKSAAKTQKTPTYSEQVSIESSPATATAGTPKSSDIKSGPTARGKQAKSTETATVSVAGTETKTEQSPAAVEEVKAPDDAVDMTVRPKTTTRKKIIKRVVRRVVRRAPAKSAGVATGQSQNPEESEETQVQVVAKENPLLGALEPDVRSENVEVPEMKEGSSVKNIEDPVTEDLMTSNAEEVAKKEEELGKNTITSIQSIVQSSEEKESTVADVEPLEGFKPTIEEEEELAIKQEKELATNHASEPKIETGEMEEDPEEDPEEEPEEDPEEDPEEEKTDFDSLLEEHDEEGVADQEVHDEDEQSQEDPPEGDFQKQGEEAASLEEEHAELNAAAKERKLRKELEIFVGGLDRDVVEEDVKRVFRYAGEVVDVRLHKDPTTNKNKGYAFVRFATKEQASRALSEMRNPVIRGKRCGVAASEDNDTLFLGNICNTWTKEAIKQKLKEYGIEAVERITLVADPKHEGLSRGFAFLEFYSHAEAMLAYKRLQKPDVIFGHSERTVKVGFAEPLREPDPEVMSQVKSVFVDGLPPHWDEDHVRQKFIGFGEIARVVLARNMSTAKRKDFGFVDFNTHEAAVACVEGINKTELVDGNSKAKVRARLSNPLPKTQAVKGGMAGGFLIARSGGTSSRFGGRGFERSGHTYNRTNIQHGTDFYPRGPGSREGFASDLDGPYSHFHGRQNFGPGERWGFRGAHQGLGRAPMPPRPDLDGARYGGRSGYGPLRRPSFPPDDAFNQPFPERRFSDCYFYEDTARGTKRPYFMENPDYAEPSARRPRFDHSEPSVSYRGTRNRDAFGADGGFYRQDYYGSDYDRGMHPSFYEGDRPYGRSFYY